MTSKKQPKRVRHSVIPSLFSLLLIVVVCSTGVSLVAAPTITGVVPRGGQRGTELSLVIEGAELSGQVRLVRDFPTVASLVTTAPDAPTGKRVVFRLRIAEAASAGVYPLRVQTSAGVSNFVLFRVGLYSELLESEPNGTLEAAHQLKVPATVNGTLGSAEVDHFRFHAEAEQRLVFDVESRRLGSALDPTLHLLAANGRELALSEDEPGLGGDARIDHTFKAAGEYILQVHDVTYAARSPGFYRLTAGPLAYARTVFPLGGQRGCEVELHFDGGYMTDGPSRVWLPDSPGSRLQVNVPPGGGGFPFFIAVGDLPEIVEGDREKPEEPIDISLPAVVNGRIKVPGEIDRFALSVEPGEKLIAKVVASELGSFLDGYLRIYDAAGKELASADDTDGQPDPRLEFAVPGGVERIVLSVHDLHAGGGGGYGYRLTVKRQSPDFYLEAALDSINLSRGKSTAFTVDVKRQAYDGPITLRPVSLPDGVRFEGGTIRAGQTRAVVVLSSDSTARFDRFPLTIRGEGSADTPVRYVGKTVVLAKDGERSVSDWRVEGVALALAESAPFDLAYAQPGGVTELVLGQSNPLPLGVQRIHGTGEIALSVLTNLAGVSFANGKVGAQDTTASVTANVAANAPLGRVGDAVVIGTGLAAVGRQQTLRLSTGLFEAKVVSPFEIELVTSSVEVVQGSESVIRGRVTRRHPFGGVVTVRVDDLPKEIKFEPINVAADANEFTLSLPKELAAQPGNVALKVIGATKLGDPKKPTDYAVAPTAVQIVVTKTSAE